MKAEPIFKRKFSITTKSGIVVVIFMDLYRLPRSARKEYPEGYKFSWIAYDLDKEEKRILFDCHDLKGPHTHLDGEKTGKPFRWTSLDAATTLFFKTIKEHFGDSEDLED